MNRATAAEPAEPMREVAAGPVSALLVGRFRDHRGEGCRCGGCAGARGRRAEASSP